MCVVNEEGYCKWTKRTLGMKSERRRVDGANVVCCSWRQALGTFHCDWVIKGLLCRELHTSGQFWSPPKKRAAGGAQNNSNSPFDGLMCSRCGHCRDHAHNGHSNTGLAVAWFFFATKSAPGAIKLGHRVSGMPITSLLIQKRTVTAKPAKIVTTERKTSIKGVQSGRIFYIA